MISKASKLSRLLTLITLAIMAMACNKRDPHPELKDPLYSDLQNRLKQTEQELAAAKEALKEAEDNLAKVVPQTGQIKYAMKRHREAKDRLLKLNQQIRYYEIKLESQVWKAKKEYLQARFAGAQWPKTDDLEDFRAMMKARQIEKNWSAKNRRKELGFKVDRKPADQAPGEDGK